MVKRAAGIAALVAAVLVIVFLKAFIYQYREFQKGETAYEQRNLRDAVTYYETAIHMYTPQSPYIKKSIDRLIEIGGAFEAQNDPRWALMTYENLRSSLYAVRSFYLPYPDVIQLCDRKISELVPKVRQ